MIGEGTIKDLIVHMLIESFYWVLGAFVTVVAVGAGLLFLFHPIDEKSEG